MEVELKKIVLSENHCPNCNHKLGEKTINIKDFTPDFLILTRMAVEGWQKRKTKCWWCKKNPAIGESWGLSINPPERNKVWCPECSKRLEKELNKSNSTKVGE